MNVSITHDDPRNGTMGPYNNTLLKHFDRETLDRLQLKPVKLELMHELAVPGQSIDYLYFVEAGMGSMTIVFKNGDQVEVGMFGYESVVGISALMGAKRSLNHIFMQLPGHGYSCPVPVAITEFRRNGIFHDLALRYVQAQLTQATQSAACNAIHNQEQRLARWLLITSDRIQSDVVDISQEFLAQMLGSTRTTVTGVAISLREKGLIDYRRGSIRILDAAGLEQHACECYLVVKDHLNNIAEFDTGFTV